MVEPPAAPLARRTAAVLIGLTGVLSPDPRAVGPLALEGDPAPALALASCDVDEDGVQDLVVGRAGPEGALVTVHRGDHRSIYPASAAEPVDGPFHGSPQRVRLPDRPELLLAGDFDADGRCDILFGARGSGALYLGRGDGRGRFRPLRAVELPGALTALAAGDLDREDGSPDVAVGVTGAGGPRVLLFEGSSGLGTSARDILALPEAATSFEFDRVDADPWVDLAVTAGSERLLVPGLDQGQPVRRIERAGAVADDLVEPGRPIAEFPLHLNGDALSDLVVLLAGRSVPSSSCRGARTFTSRNRERRAGLASPGDPGRQCTAPGPASTSKSPGRGRMPSSSRLPSP